VNSEVVLVGNDVFESDSEMPDYAIQFEIVADALRPRPVAEPGVLRLGSLSAK
jgi:hypothetical protein